MSKNKRDLMADLEIINAATPGPWLISPHSNFIGIMTEGRFYEVAKYFDKHDARFISEAREGWPYAIRRAIRAEDRSELMEAEIERLRSVISDVTAELNSIIYTITTAGGAGQPVDMWALSSALVDIGARLQKKSDSEIIAETD